MAVPRRCFGHIISESSAPCSTDYHTASNHLDERHVGSLTTEISRRSQEWLSRRSQLRRQEKSPRFLHTASPWLETPPGIMSRSASTQPGPRSIRTSIGSGHRPRRNVLPKNK